MRLLQRLNRKNRMLITSHQKVTRKLTHIRAKVKYHLGLGPGEMKQQLVPPAAMGRLDTVRPKCSPNPSADVKEPSIR